MKSNLDIRGFDVDISKKLVELKQLCLLKGMPMFCSVAIVDDEAETKYQTEMLSPNILGIKLKDDKFPDYVMVASGYHAVTKTGVDFDF